MATMGDGQKRTKKLEQKKKEGGGLTRHVEMGTVWLASEF
jgi:hypothetical protein